MRATHTALLLVYGLLAGQVGASRKWFLNRMPDSSLSVPEPSESDVASIGPCALAHAGGWVGTAAQGK